MRKRIMSLLLCLIMALSLLPAAAVTAFAEGATQSGKATLIGFEAGKKAGDARIQNNGMTILDATGTDGKNPMYIESKVRQTAILSPYCPPYGMTQHPKYVYNDYSATAIIVQKADKSGTQRRLLKDDTFKAGMTYRFTFQDTLWPVNRSIKGGGYLGELTKDNFTISGAEVVKVERVAQRLNLSEAEAMQGFFYNVWIKISGTEQSHKVQYADNNVESVTGLVNVSSSANNKTGYAEEGDTIKVTAAKSKTVGSESWFFIGWEVTANGTRYTDPAYIQYYCNLTQFTSNTSGDPVSCTFLMGDKDIKIAALYGKPGSAGVGNVTFNNVKLWVTPPITGAKGVAAAVPEFDGMGAAYQIDKVEWLEDNETGAYNYLHMDPGKTFDTANKCYTMRVVLKMNSGYAFTDKNGVTITINGKTYGTGTANTLYNAESRTIPVTYSYSEANKSLAIYIPVGGAGVKTRLDTTRYAGQAALTFSDGKDVAAITGVEAYKADETTAAATVNATGETLVLPAGKYTVKVNVTVSEAMHKLIQNSGTNGNNVTLNSAMMGLVKVSASGNTQVSFAPDYSKKDNGNSTWTYTFTSNEFEVGSNDQYLLAAALNLKAKPLIPQYETTYSSEMRITDANLTTNAVIRGKADNSITGSIVYTSAVRYNQPVTTGITVQVNGTVVEESKHQYKWQRSADGTTWTDIEGESATGKQYTPVEADVGKQIRVVVSANGYSGSIIGAAKTVERASQTAPGKPQLTVESDTDGNYKAFTIGNYNADTYEYFWTTNASDTPTAKESVENGKVSGNSGDVFYVYVRCKETNTHKTSPWSEVAVVKLAAMEDLFMVSLKDSSNNVYLGKNLSGDEKVYIQKNTDAEFTVIKNPEAATTWEVFTFKNLNSGDNEKLTVTNSSVEANDGTGTNTIPEKITIKGTEVGVYTLGAYKGSNDAYGSWKIVVYDPSDVTSTRVDDVSYTRPVLNDITLNVGDVYTIEFDTAQLNVRPSGALDSRLAWKVSTGAAAGAYGDTNGYLSISYDSATEKYTVKALKKTEGAEDGLRAVCLVADNRTFASFNVTVTADTSTTSPDDHEHHYSSNYTRADDTYHTQKCESCAALKMEEHSWSGWTVSASDSTKHTGTCAKCHATITADHTWTWVVTTAATDTADGEEARKCAVCGVAAGETRPVPCRKTPDPVTVSVAAPAHNGTAQNATVTGTGYTVANTVFYAPDGTAVMPGGKFAANTQYTAYVTLEAKVDEGYVFAMKKGEKNIVYQINDKETPADILFAYTGYETVGGALVEVTNVADSRDTITLTYEFQPTGQNSYYYNNCCGTTKNNGQKTNGATTADPGILLYGMMALSSYTGTALLVRGRKKHD